MLKVVGLTGISPTATITTDDYIYTGHKSLVMAKSSSGTPAINIETALLPVKKSTYYANAFMFNKQSGNALRFFWYDKNGTEIGQTTAYQYFPSVGSENEWFMGSHSKRAIAPPEAAFFKAVFYFGNWAGEDVQGEGTVYKIGGLLIN